ncbi:10307_t:CDS:2 [Gigaspora rosea]|nr:10307_t:CDS:2 [Gigaspora rosea]
MNSFHKFCKCFSYAEFGAMCSNTFPVVFSKMDCCCLKFQCRFLHGSGIAFSPGLSLKLVVALGRLTNSTSCRKSLEEDIHNCSNFFNSE